MQGSLLLNIIAKHELQNNNYKAITLVLFTKLKFSMSFLFITRS